MKRCVVDGALTRRSSITRQNIKRFMLCRPLGATVLLPDRIKRDACSGGPLGGALLLLQGREQKPDLLGPWSDGRHDFDPR